MKAVFYTQVGGPEVLTWGELPTPTPGQGEVLVRVKAVSVNPIDTYIRSGAVPMARPEPTIPGCDLAGVVEAVGPGCQKFQPGDRVWGSNQGLLGRQGTFAEYAAVNEAYLYAIPDGVSDEVAAATALVGITAHLGLVYLANVQAGEYVFVNGGTGGVGAMVVQMAKCRNAYVACTCGNEEKEALAKELGATRTINYRTEDIGAAIQDFTQQQGLHIWYETLREPDYEKMVSSMRLRGRMIAMAGRTAKPPFPHGPFYVKCLTLYGFAMFQFPPEEQQKCAVDINEWLSSGKLKPLIGKVMPLSECQAAHRLQEENTLQGAGTLTGKIVLTVD
ncbi:MAG: NADPH:quinone reductase [Zavarzinella sp.]